MFFPLCIGELTLRIYAPRLGTHDDFLRFSANVLEQGQSLVEYGTYIDQRDFADDPEGRDLLGWSRTSNWYDDKPTAQEKFSILLLGDSVTQGDGLEP